MEELRNDLKSSFDDHSISVLCATDDTDTILILCFEAASPLNKILKKFVTVSQDNVNDFFRIYWNKRKSCVNQTITFSDILTTVWDKAFHDCVQFIQSLRDRTILLSDVESLLHNYETKSILVNNIKSLEVGICRCIGRSIDGEQGWIDGCVNRMYQYKSLSCHASTATTFLQLKEMLQLEGDFSLVENLGDEVSIS